MPQTLLEVANSALIKIGARRITALNEATKEAETVQARIRQVRDMMLRSHVWTAFRKFATPAAVAGDVPPWAFYYAIPADCCRLLSLRLASTHQRVSGYELVGSRVYTDVAALRILYVRQPQTAQEANELYPDDFAEAWAAYLAAEISTAIYDSPDRRAQWLDQYVMLLRQARFNGAVEAPYEAISADSWLESRVTGLNDPRDVRGLDAPPGGI